MTSLFPPRESLVVTSRLGPGNSRTFFLPCLQYLDSHTTANHPFGLLATHAEYHYPSLQYSQYICTDGYGQWPCNLQKGSKSRNDNILCSGALLVHGKKPGSKIYIQVHHADRSKAWPFSSLNLRFFVVQLREPWPRDASSAHTSSTLLSLQALFIL
jgi:hypothetical protein